MAFVSHLSRRYLSVSSSHGAKIKELVIVGAGQMGSGVAQVAAATGHKVTIVDTNQDLLDKAQAGIEKSVRRVANKQYKEDTSGADGYISSTLSNLSTSLSAEAALASADLLVEAVTENLDLKKKLFSEWDAMAPASTIFASNTSSLPISQIASATTRPDRFGGLHFFNPVPIMKLLEVVRIDQTSDQTFDALLEFGKNLNKVTVSCKDTPGFVVNRLLVPYLMEAVRMLERGDATAADIDTAMKLGAGHPMGPFQLSDYIGNDTNKFIMDGWSERFPEETLFRQSELLNSLVEQGKLGRKTGEGFHKY